MQRSPCPNVGFRRKLIMTKQFAFIAIVLRFMCNLFSWKLLATYVGSKTLL